MTTQTAHKQAVTYTAVPCVIHSWLICKLPKEASETLPSRGQVMVNGTINGIAFQAAFEPDGAGGHWFRVTKELQATAGVAAGKKAMLTVEPTKVWPEPDVPADWQSALDADPAVMAQWKRVTPMARWEWLRWIASTNKAETRRKHIEVACSKLLRGERRPCCFNRAACCVPEVSKGGMLIQP
jgi:hypothetical protein